MPIKTLQIPTADGQADAFAAFPDHGERHPGVLMYADGFRHPARAAGDGARTGRARLLRARPQLLLPARPGTGGRASRLHRRRGPGRGLAQLMPLIEAHTAERVLGDADAYLKFLTTQPEVCAGPVAVTGYCTGGLYAMRTRRGPPQPGWPQSPHSTAPWASTGPASSPSSQPGSTSATPKAT